MNYVASGKIKRSRAQVSWIKCCQEKKSGGINLINPDDAPTSLMAKWLPKALELEESNLQLLLRSKLAQYQPYSRGRWQSSIEFFTIPKHQAKQWSIVWNQVIFAWKLLPPFISYVCPTNREELLSCSWWWCPGALVIGLGFSNTRATTLHKAGLQRYRDAWVQGRFMTTTAAKVAFGLLDRETCAWDGDLRHLKQIRQDLLQASNHLRVGE